MTENSDTKSLEELLAEFYQGEVFGEAFLVELLKRFRSSSQQYKLGTLLQLETETKARIRPVIAAYGVDLAELPESRKGGIDAAESVPIEDWDELMGVLLEPSRESNDQYRQMAESLPSELSAFSEMMREHEQAIHEFFVRETAGRGEQSVAHIVEMLQNPLPEPPSEAA